MTDRQQAEQSAIEQAMLGSPQPHYVASFKSHNGWRAWASHSRTEVEHWLVFNRDYTVAGTQQVTAIDN